MTTPSQLRNKTHALIELGELVQRRLPEFIAATHALIAANDGYPSSASGADTGIRGASSGSSVERAVVARIGDRDEVKGRRGPDSDVEQVADLLSAAGLAFSSVLDVFNRYAARLSEDDKRRLRCIGDGTAEGATCDRWAEPGRKGMCIRCYTNARRRDSRTDVA